MSSALRLDHNELLKVEGVVVNQFTGHTGLHQNLVDELLAEGLPVLPVYLSSSVKMRESHEVSVPIIHLAPRHKLSREFLVCWMLWSEPLSFINDRLLQA